MKKAVMIAWALAAYIVLCTAFQIAYSFYLDYRDRPESPKRADGEAAEKSGTAEIFLLSGDSLAISDLLSAPPYIFDPVNRANGSTPLHAACTLRAGPETVRFLLDNGADPGARDAFRRTPLHNAVIFGADPATILLLTNRGARADATDVYGKRPFDYGRGKEKGGGR